MRRGRVTGYLAVSAAVGLLALGQAWGAQAGKSPIKVFILAGQSNMEGQGIIRGDKKGTLESLLKDPASADRYKHLVDKDGKWVVRDDVWCVYGKKGSLTVGGYAAGGCIGPELGFGWQVGDYFDNQVLLIKVAVGGTSLAQNWRPPSSGGTVGGWYLEMIKGVKEQLNNLKTDFSGYDGKGYEIAGFGWHQGWQDGCAQDMADEYEKNMANFIRDVRKEFGVPKLPFVIGNSGFGGWEQTNGRRLKVMEAQLAVAKYPEFEGTVFTVETRDFYRAEDVSPHKFRYHWNGNAETYYLIGEGMGKAMVKILQESPSELAGPGPYTKLAAIAEQIKQGQDLGSALKTLTAKKSSKDPVEAAEATMMYTALLTGAQEQLDWALSEKDKDPMGTIGKLERIAVQFAGSDIATKAKQETKTIVKNPIVQKEMQAATMLKQVIAMEEGMKPFNNTHNPKDNNYRLMNKATIQGVIGGCQTIIQRYPGTAAATKAEEVMKKYQ